LQRQHLATALLLIFIGLISASSYNITNEYKRTATANEETNVWEISSHFTKEENITLYMRWTVPWTELDVPPLPANISIFAPDNGETKFRVYFQLVPSQSSEEAQPIEVSRIELLGTDEDGLSTTNPIKQIGGITKQSGTYTARISREGLWWVEEPPEALVFFKEIVERDKPYTYLLPVGVSLCLLGVLILIYGVFTARKIKKKRLLAKRRH